MGINRVLSIAAVGVLCFGPFLFAQNPDPGTPMPIHKTDSTDSEDAIRPLDEMMADYIRKALERANGRVEGETGAAKMLGLHPSTLRGRMKKLKIPYGRGMGYCG